MTTIIWFQRDLRVQDNPALKYASQLQLPILPIYIFDAEEDSNWSMGSSSRWWLHYSLQSLQKKLRELGLDLFFFQGATLHILQEIIDKADAKHIVWNYCYEPSALVREKKLIKLASAKKCIAKGFHANLLFVPGQITTKQGNPYQVFTPFWRCCLKQEVGNPEGRVTKKLQLASYSKHISLNTLDLLPHIPWAQDFSFLWQPGEDSALKKWKHFLKGKIHQYAHGRDFPAERGTSMLSPHLHFGEISVKRIFEDLLKNTHSEVFLREIGWREFANHLLIAFPHTPSKPLRVEYTHFPWKRNAKWLKAWQKGMTGIPIVDAGMRQLWQLGWMHNRVRMIVASFLVKDLNIPWQEGAKWFWDTLVDADLANNTLGWQWCAGCGADAAPYFRIFNPFTQGKKFDPKAEYVRQFVPELKKLPNSYIHTPHLAPKSVLEEAGVYLGKNYPYPIVDHDLARKRALQVYHQWNKHGYKS
ncbi:deoxyribodipyrimidine photo-lyase [Candidatus Rhabdochlamydia sp. T3358]|uniref:cryptochrome/photolyase family protein n=1 Tax=Candidatus Rhabdochlamydia sp. T3358 TaxID=2099795 RepID=UPI0010B0CECE|nr:deoxyribodipyrimidine photo-lyase [Candidatus Rhabdochlamydia sp. T3358]VHO03847.1 Deoxyribodipyrimidine photo-lyase [Candidatus Rhabdochlamydia sp. T3358]